MYLFGFGWVLVLCSTICCLWVACCLRLGFRIMYLGFAGLPIELWIGYGSDY